MAEMQDLENNVLHQFQVARTETVFPGRQVPVTHGYEFFCLLSPCSDIGYNKRTVLHTLSGLKSHRSQFHKVTNKGLPVNEIEIPELLRTGKIRLCTEVPENTKPQKNQKPLHNKPGNLVFRAYHHPFPTPSLISYFSIACDEVSPRFLHILLFPVELLQTLDFADFRL
jgi:hypothetical protein